MPLYPPLPKVNAIVRTAIVIRKGAASLFIHVFLSEL